MSREGVFYCVGGSGTWANQEEIVSKTVKWDESGISRSAEFCRRNEDELSIAMVKKGVIWI